MDATCSTCMPARIHQFTLARTAVPYSLCFWFCPELWANDVIESCFFFFIASSSFLGNQLRSLLQALTLLSENFSDFTSSSRSWTDQTFHCT